MSRERDIETLQRLVALDALQELVAIEPKSDEWVRSTVCDRVPGLTELDALREVLGAATFRRLRDEPGNLLQMYGRMLEAIEQSLIDLTVLALYEREGQDG